MSELGIRGRQFVLDGEPFLFTGVSFFNAIFNDTFNHSSAQRRGWMQKFLDHGVNVLRIWGQWDNHRAFIDTSPQATLYQPDGALNPPPMDCLHGLLDDAQAMGMVIELAIFARESKVDGVTLQGDAADRAVAELAEAVRPHRNLALQIWNECSDRVLDHVATIRRVDPHRLVTNSPGVAGELGDEPQNRTLDYLTPHTSRQWPWVRGPREIADLLEAYDKPVVDDEPARNGTPQFGGPSEATHPAEHMLQMYEVWKLGGYSIYHHDMFQTGYGTPAIAPHGIPEPTFSPYHRQVFAFLAMQPRYREGLGQ